MKILRDNLTIQDIIISFPIAILLGIIAIFIIMYLIVGLFSFLFWTFKPISMLMNETWTLLRCGIFIGFVIWLCHITPEISISDHED